MMTIENDHIMILNQQIDFDAAFNDVYDKLQNHVYTHSNEYIMIQHQEFYGLQGTCTLHFKDQKLQRIVMHPEWSLHSLVDKNGKQLHIDDAVWMVRQNNTKELRKYFEPVDTAAPQTWIYTNGTFNIVGRITKENDNYSVIITRKEPEHAE